VRGGTTGVPLAVGICPHHTFIAASKSDSPCDFRLGSPPLRHPCELSCTAATGPRNAYLRIYLFIPLRRSAGNRNSVHPPLCIGRSGLRLKPGKPQPASGQADGNCPPRAPSRALFPRSEAALKLASIPRPNPVFQPKNAEIGFVSCVCPAVMHPTGRPNRCLPGLRTPGQLEPRSSLPRTDPPLYSGWTICRIP